MIANVSPCEMAAESTMNTLNYANRLVWRALWAGLTRRSFVYAARSESRRWRALRRRRNADAVVTNVIRGGYISWEYIYIIYYIY